MKRYLQIIKYSTLLSFGIVRYKFGSKNLSSAYQSLIMLFCLTRGRSNQFLAKCISVTKTKLSLDGETKTLKSLNTAKIDSGSEMLKKKGYAVFEDALNSTQIKHFLKSGYSTDMEISLLDSQSPNTIKIRTKYDPNNLRGVRYEVDPAQILNDPMIQELVCDQSILKVAQNYLNAPPILDFVTMWWNTNYSKTAESNAAQLYHFDLDRIRWVKFFFYITDVEAENGPHCFMEGTHLPGAIPIALLKRGYQRIMDNEIFQHFDRTREIRLTGKAGTMIAEDTIGLHKGQNVEKGHRLVLQLQYTNSLFGNMPNWKKCAPTNQTLISAAKRNPKIFSNCFKLN